jgi:hypothetical protein
MVLNEKRPHSYRDMQMANYRHLAAQGIPIYVDVVRGLHDAESKALSAIPLGRLHHSAALTLFVTYTARASSLNLSSGSKPKFVCQTSYYRDADMCLKF